MVLTSSTYIFEPIFAELRQQMQESEEGEPGAPQQHLVNELHVDDAKHKYELVEHEVPELVAKLLLFRDPQFPKDQLLDRPSQQD